MVEIVTLLAGLTLGPATVQLAVDGEPASIVLGLDGAEVERLSAPPWSAELDFGDLLRPRRVSAVALDAAGRELDRDERLVNVHRPPAGVDWVLHRNSQGWLTMLELPWRSRAGARPGRFAVSVDGRAVEAEDASAIWVPPLDPAVPHLIEAVVAYSDGSVTRDWLAFGGPALGEASARVTPVQADAPGADASSLIARRARDGAEVAIVAVERGDAEIIVVRDAEAARAAGNLVPSRRVTGALSGARDAQAARLIHAVPLAANEWVRIVDASAPRPATSRLEPERLPMRRTGDQAGDFGLLWHLRTRDDEVEPGDGWATDAVALAASRLARGPRRAAVVLALTTGSDDGASELAPATVTSYLETLAIPLHVWYLGKAARAPGEWGAPSEVRGVGGLEKALDGLRADLDRRRVVWVEGVHLPGEVGVSAR